MKIKLKNYTTDVPASKTIAEIQELLAKSGARGIAFEYDASGNIESLFFRLQIPNGKDVTFKLPAKPDAVYEIMFAGRPGEYTYGESRRQKSLNIAWRIIKEWLEVQLSLIQLNQADAVEIFLPYMVTGENRTLYQDLKENQFRLASGAAEEVKID
jgi:hypothetical protein